AFHVAVIDEVGTGVAGGPSQQFVEIRMLAASQNQVKNSVLAAFDARGTYAGDVLVVPGDLGGSGVRWLMATRALQDRQGIAADFTFEPGLLPLEDGMICWGAPGDALPADPGSWDHSDFTEYVHCVAYGRFSGSPPEPPGRRPSSPAPRPTRAATWARRGTACSGPSSASRCTGAGARRPRSRASACAADRRTTSTARTRLPCSRP